MRGEEIEEGVRWGEGEYRELRERVKKREVMFRMGGVVEMEGEGWGKVGGGVYGEIGGIGFLKLWEFFVVVGG
ncbi:hypothetical protein [Neisseria sicca]|uniref:hypothetical protein n=1 Tax=Neisseria sicca TaxID=490 RepID=UPI0011BD1DAF